jgi:hypothetical protein
VNPTVDSTTSVHAEEAIQEKRTAFSGRRKFGAPILQKAEHVVR